jgi:hypothetical protein
VPAIRQAGLTDDEVSMLAAYLYDRESQASIAARLNASQQTTSNRIRAAVRRFEAASGLTVTMPLRRSSRPAWQQGRRVRVRLVDPFKFRLLNLDRPACGGITTARGRATKCRSDRPMEDQGGVAPEKKGSRLPTACHLSHLASQLLEVGYPPH